MNVPVKKDLSAIKTEDPSDHRLSLRLPVDLGIDLDVPASGKTSKVQEHVKGRLDNLSNEGLCVTVSKLTPDNEEKLLRGDLTINVEFQIPMPDHKVGTEGRVVWIKNRGKEKALGIHLEHIDEDSKKKILHYILNRIVESQFNS